jgi:hypothetical protein
MGVLDEDRLTVLMRDRVRGYVEIIRAEVEQHPQRNEVMPDSHGMTLLDWFNYVLNEPASELVFNNGIRDSGRPAMRFAAFCRHQIARDCGLNRAHVLALRLYTTKVFWYINSPFRQNNGGRVRLQNPMHRHPMPATVMFLREGMIRLRTQAEKELQGQGATSLWRGMRGLRVHDEFLQNGGTELAPMSTSTNLAIAANYSCNGAEGETALIMKLKIPRNGFHQYGAGLGWLSAFPDEVERLFPPLTYLRPTERAQQNVTVEGIDFTIVEVEPHY